MRLKVGEEWEGIIPATAPEVRPATPWPHARSARPIRGLPAGPPHPRLALRATLFRCSAAQEPLSHCSNHTRPQSTRQGMSSDGATTEDTDHTDVRSQPIPSTLLRRQDDPERLEESVPHRLRVIRVFRGYSDPWFWERDKLLPEFPKDIRAKYVSRGGRRAGPGQAGRRGRGCPARGRG